MTKLAARSLYNQIAARIQAQLVCSFEGKADYRRIGSWSHYEVVLKALLVAIVDHANARINVFITNSRKPWHSSLPFLRVGACKVIALACKLIKPEDRMSRVCADELHPDDSGGQCQHCFS